LNGKKADKGDMTRNKWSFILLLTFFLAIPSAGAREKTLTYHDTSICIQDVHDMGYLNFFTWSAKEILDALAGSEFLDEREWKTIQTNPKLTLFIKPAADLGLEISKSICPVDPDHKDRGIYEVDDEVDAVRHFVMSSYLTWKAGPLAARTFMAAHEDNMFASDNMMDYYNNNLGFEFGEKFRQKHLGDSFATNSLPDFIAEIKKEIRRKHALEKGNPQDFLVLKTGPSVCARKKYPNF
jgi:hypothetical protein